MPTRPEPITSRANARVKQLRGALAGHARPSSGLLAIEGEHLVEEAVRSGLIVKSIFLCEGQSLPPSIGRLHETIEVLRLSEQVFASLSDTRAPQGIAALLMPPVHTFESMLRQTPLIVVAAGLQDPGNLGTLIRSAEAFGSTGVLTTTKTVDPWNQKSLRASAGSVFRIPVKSASHADLIGLKQHGIRVVAAVRSDSGLNPSMEMVDADLVGPTAILIGNEGAGLAPELLGIADGLVCIPTTGTVESLNAAVAGSILLYEAFRLRSSVSGPAFAPRASQIEAPR